MMELCSQAIKSQRAFLFVISLDSWRRAELHGDANVPCSEAKPR